MEKQEKSELIRRLSFISPALAEFTEKMESLSGIIEVLEYKEKDFTKFASNFRRLSGEHENNIFNYHQDIGAHQAIIALLSVRVDAYKEMYKKAINESIESEKLAFMKGFNSFAKYVVDNAPSYEDIKLYLEEYAKPDKSSEEPKTCQSFPRLNFPELNQN